MIYKINRGTVFSLTLMLWLIAWTNVQASDAREDVITLVRSLGYGAGIHNFKNFVLRGRDENYDAAKQSFGIALGSLNRLAESQELGVDDRAAVAILKNMVKDYDKGLDLAISLRRKGWRLGDVDRSVFVDDSIPIASLDQLRNKWKWSELEQIEYQLGYGKAIHNFKNYVLRGDERFQTQALENFLAVESLLNNQYGNSDLDSAQKAALDQVKRVAQSYRNYLDLVDRFHTQQYPIRKIDLAVKVNDKPAIDGLTILSK